jgi:hypothetical protein
VPDEQPDARGGGDRRCAANLTRHTLARHTGRANPVANPRSLELVHTQPFQHWRLAFARRGRRHQRDDDERVPRVQRQGGSGKLLSTQTNSIPCLALASSSARSQELVERTGRNPCYEYLQLGCSQRAVQRMLHYARTQCVGKPFSNYGMARSVLWPRNTDGSSFFCAGAPAAPLHAP